MRAALLQLCSGDDPAANLATTEAMLREAAAGGAGFVLTPEASNCISLSRSRQNEVLHQEADDPFLARMRELAAELGLWISLGSLALKTNDADGRFANRSFLLGPDGGIRARYDKIHMFDVSISEKETYSESKGYRPGSQAVLHDAGFARIGLSICYDLRFPHLFRDLAKAGAQILLIPAAFSPETGRAHWQTLLRARAIETGCFVLAAAQTGTHPSRDARARQTHGHSLAIAPWGEVLADGGAAPGIITVDLDLAQIAQARQRLPSLTHDRAYSAPICELTDGP